MTNASRIQIKKFQLVEIPVQYQRPEGCVAFQQVELTYSFYGKQMNESFDTKILKNGDQLVISGNGFIKDNYKIN
jgi:hypothetical protein